MTPNEKQKTAYTGDFAFLFSFFYIANWKKRNYV